MASETEKKEESSESPSSGAKKSSIPFIPLINTVAILAVVGFAAYTKLIYKHVKITESTEKEKLDVVYTKKTVSDEPVYIAFEPITVNLKPFTPRPANQTHIGKLHYVTLKFTLQISDEKYKEDVEKKIQPFIMDQVISLIGKKQYHDLVNVQGRYILQTELIEALNDLISKQLKIDSSDGVVTQLFFTQFVVQ